MTSHCVHHRELIGVVRKTLYRWCLDKMNTFSLWVIVKFVHMNTARTYFQSSGHVVLSVWSTPFSYVFVFKDTASQPFPLMFFLHATPNLY